MASNSTTSGASLVEDNKVSLIEQLSNSTSAVAAEGASGGGGGLSGGAVAGIVIGVVVGVLLLSVFAFFAFKYIKDRRKNHGEYRPQFEEQHHAKDLPYLQPPNVEGLI